MSYRPSVTISENELKSRPEYYLNQVEWEGFTLLIERNGIIAAKIQPPDLSSVAGENLLSRRREVSHY